MARDFHVRQASLKKLKSYGVVENFNGKLLMNLLNAMLERDRKREKWQGIRSERTSIAA